MAGATSTKTWNATADFGKHPTVNPAPDKYHHPGVWSWEYGTVNTPSTYTLGNYQSPATIKADCGSKVKKFYGWQAPAGIEDGATVVYNKGATVTPGQNTCAPRDTFAKKTLFMGPSFESTSADSIIAWKSPVTGTVSVSGSITGVDPDETGVTYELDQGTTVLVGPSLESSDTTANFSEPSISVTSGQSLYFEVGDGPSGDGGADVVAVTLSIRSS
jgi:hypothetical protein